MTLTIERPTKARVPRAREKRDDILTKALRYFSPRYVRLEEEEKAIQEEIAFLKREREALIEAARRGGLI